MGDLMIDFIFYKIIINSENLCSQCTLDYLGRCYYSYYFNHLYSCPVYDQLAYNNVCMLLPLCLKLN